MIAILACHILLLGWSAKQHSPALHEVGHVPAGLRHWQFQMFHLYRVNPPLPRLVATFPLLFVDLKTDWTNYSMSSVSREEIPLGIRFVEANGEESFWLYTLARWACIPFSLLGAIVCYKWATDLWGQTSGLLALAIWCFSPTILGHGSVVMPDVPAAATGIGASYLFWHWLKYPTWSSALAAGCALGLANLCKTTLIVLYGVWPLLWLIQAVVTQSAPMRKSLRQLAMLASAMAVSVIVINLGYGFNGSFQRLGDFWFLSSTLSGEPIQKEIPIVGNRFIDTWFEKLPVPLPNAYLQGIDRQRSDFELMSRSYLRGHWSQRGFWYYYLYAMAIKVPLGTWLLLVLMLFGTFFLRWFPNRWFDELCLVLPMAAILILVSSQVGFSHHMRYIIPALPFGIVWISKVGFVFVQPSVMVSRCVLFGVAWSIASSLWIYPHSISYFNELVGGPRNGHNYLLDSNIAWGQDLLYLRRWLNGHPEARPLHLASYGMINPRIAGIEFTEPPIGPQRPLSDLDAIEWQQLGPLPGCFIVDVNYLHGSHWQMATGGGGWRYIPIEELNYEYFLHFRPVDRIGYSMCVYLITREDANRVRRLLGMPKI